MKRKNRPLLLEQLEDRIFLDANPLVVADDGVDHVSDPVVDPVASNPVESAAEVVPAESEGADQQIASKENDVAAEGEVVNAEEARSDDASEQEEGVEAQDGETEAEENNTTESQADQDVNTLGAGDSQEPDDALQDQESPESDSSEISASSDSSESEEPNSTTIDSETVVAAVEAIDPMIGENFDFTVSLNNDTAATLYGPYVDLYMPTSGDDGDGDGVSFVDAFYLEQPVNATVQTFDGDGHVTHPYAVDDTGNPIIINGTAGDTYVTLEMPFGSFTPNQPAAEITINAHIDEHRQVDAAGGDAEDFDILVYNGYRYGLDPLDNPTEDEPVDPTLVETQTFRPEVIRFEKEYIGPEQETATGPNYPRQYQVTIDIADGQTINNLQLTEHLPNEIYYMGDATVSVSGGHAFTVTSPNAAGGIFTDGILNVQLDNPVTGTTAGNDVVITFDFYVPQFYADGVTPILDPNSGDDAIGGTEDRQVINDVQVEGDWTPTDGDDTPTHIVMDAEVDSEGIISPTPANDEEFSAEAIAIQKGVELVAGGDTGVIGGYNPGDIVRYTLEFQISDYFNFGDIMIDDVLPDGLQFQETGTYAPTFSIQDETGSWNGDWVVGTNLTTVTQGDDDTELHFDVSAVAGGPDGILQGDLYDDATFGNPATGTITYYAQIKDEYASTGDSSGPGDLSIDQGDLFENNVDIEGQIYGDDGAGGLTSTGYLLDQDDSSASLQIDVGAVSKEIYAINGDTDMSAYTDAQGRLHMQPGYTVTYRVSYHMPTSEFEEFRLDDYLPLPVLNAGEVATFDADESDAVPIAGHYHRHTNDSYSETFNQFPTLDINTSNGENRVSFVYANHDDTTPQETTIDILFTVTVSDDPFADGLFLTNQVQGKEDGTPLISSDTNAIAQIVLDEPELEISKGVVATDNPAGLFAGSVGPVAFSVPGTAGYRGGGDITESGLAANKVDANLSNIDAGDLVTFAIVAQNVGHSGAFDIKITDNMPAGFDIDVVNGLNLSVTDGSGTALTFTDASGDSVGDAGFDFFSGIILVDDGDGALNANDDTVTDQTDNIVVITYDLLSQSSVIPQQEIVNTAQVADMAGADGGVAAGSDHYPVDSTGPHDDATVTVVEPAINKDYHIAFDMDGDGTPDSFTSQGHTSDDTHEVAIGELISYEITMTIPEGTMPDVKLGDWLNSGYAQDTPGIALVSLDTITASAGLAAGEGDFDDILTNAVVYSDGTGFRLNFGDITNTNNSNDQDEEITITFTAVVLDTDVTDRGDEARNSSNIRWDDAGGNELDPIVDGVTPLTIVEPTLEVIKSIDNPTPDDGDTVTFTIVVRHDDPTSNSDAFDAILSDSIPPGYENATITSQSGTGSLAGITNAASINGAGDTLSGTWSVFETEDTYTITLTADLISPPQAGTNLSNTATVDWTSLPGDHTDLSPYTTTGDTERTGTPADGDPDDYIVSATAEVTVAGTIDKVQPDPSSYTIGDEVQYYIIVTLPEGSTNDLIVADDLPAGMQYITGSHEVFTTTAGDPSGLLGQDFSGVVALQSVSGGTADGEAVQFTYGDISIASDNDPDGENDAFVIGFKALVTDAPANQGDPDGDGPESATSLENEASMSYANPDGGDPITIGDDTDPIVTVVEPQITTEKSVVDTDADPATVIAEPGETLTYTARFTNTGASTAYEVNAVDTLATGTEFVALITAVDNGNTDLLGTTSMNDNGDGTVSISGDWDIAVGDWVEVQYTVTVMAAGFTANTPDDNHSNTVNANWSSRDGDDSNERQYNDTGTSPLDGDQDIDNAVFTVITNGSIGDTVFFDADGDGGEFNAEAGDTTPDVGIDGVTVRLYADMNGDGDYDDPEDILLRTDTTETGGLYMFENLPEFTDYIVVVDPDLATADGFSLTNAGYSPTYDLDEGAGAAAIDHTATTINLAADQHRTDVDFGYTGQNSVGDTVWFDVDANGVQDTGEDGIGGLTVTLTADVDHDGVKEYTATAITDEDGHYSFDHLPAGDFDVTVTPPGGTTATYDQDGGNGSPDNTTPFTLGADQDRDDIDFGLRGTGSIGDFVWHDADGLGDQNEGVISGIGGVTVTLSGDIDGDNSIDYTTTTITNPDGSYLFDNLLGGNYTVTVNDTTLPAGMSQTFDLDGTDTANTAAVVLASGTNRDDIDFGYRGTTSVGDTVWFDVNNNGEQDTDEGGIGNVVVSISADIDGDGNAEYTSNTITDGNGQYSFDNLSAGNYTISVVPPAGGLQTYDHDDGHGATNNQAVFVMDGTNNRGDIDFGYRGTGSIGDFVWYDADADGVQNDGLLSGFAGVTVTLSGDIDNDGNPDYTATTVTNADGNYSFDNLLGGSYTLTVDAASLPGGTSNWHQTYDLDDTTGPFTSPHSAVAVDLGINGADLNRTDVDFAYTGNGSIGDTVFFDADNSGSETNGDTGITDVLVTLTADINGDGTPDFTWTDTTDGTGQYLFENLPSFDNYTVTVDPVNLPAGTRATYDLDGIATEHVATGIALAVNEDRVDVDFGYFTSGTGSIGDTVWYDADADGVLDAGEQGIAGVELTLAGDITGDGVDDISFTTTTDANGNYNFGDLLAGDYTVTVTDRPNGMEQTFDLDGLATADEASLVLADGEQNNNVDFGYTGAANIGDTVYFDADNSGTETPGDAGIPGVTVTLTGDVNNDGIEDVLTATTDANGTYLFENLPDGNYVISVDPSGLPAGMNQTADPDGGDDNTSAVTLAGGVDDVIQDFGYTGTGSIGDTIWEDTDGDGTQNGTESGLTGVDVTLSVDFDGDGTPDYTQTVTTDGTGHYSFDNLPEGTYTIEVDTNTIPAGYVLTGDPDSNPDSTSTVNLPAGGTDLNQDFGYQDSQNPTGSIGDTVYLDADGSGTQDGSEAGLAGVTVTLTGDIDGDGTVDTVTATTDANGQYLFDNLPEGDYTITIDPATLPAGVTPTGDPDGGADNTSDVTLAPGTMDNLDQDFGYNGTGSIGDTIYFDGNNNGTQDGNEGGIVNVEVILTADLNGDGVADYSATARTDEDGQYLFENLPAAEYTITVTPATLPGGMNQSADPDSAYDNSSTYNLSGGESNLDQDFGYIGTGSIGDTIWNDTDGNGTQNGSESGISGVNVTVTADIDNDGIPDYTETVSTDNNGNYLFENLPEGAYTISVDPTGLPDGMSQSGDPDGLNDNTANVTLTPGAMDNLDQDFGYNSGTGSIGDTIFFDVDGNGTQDAGETGLSGVIVTMTSDIDGDGNPDTVTTTTDSNGNYLFDNLPAGDYSIAVDPSTLPAGMTQTADPDGGNDNASAVTLADGENNVLQDFGYQGTGSIGDTIWVDADGDGTQNNGETGLTGVGVTLTVDFNGDGTPDYTETVTTDGTGNYIFENLPAGEYTISVDTNTVPSGYILTGDPDSNPDSTATVILPAGGTNLDQDFGYQDSQNPTGSIGDTIYFDENNNNTQDGDDVGLSGVTVTLVGDIDGDGTPDTVTTTTDSNGSYLFDNLPEGDYTVTVDPATLPAGMIPVQDPDGGGDNTSAVTLATGTMDNLDQDFGYTGTGVIGDSIYFDTDGDGIQDSGENGIPGVGLTISVDFDGDGNPDYTLTTTTDANGNYSFDNLPAGEYTVTIDPASLPGDVTASGDPDSIMDNSATVNLAPGATNNDQDFGYTGTGSIGDTIYFDADGNGLQSPNELGLAGVTVTLQGDFDNDGSIDSVTTVTDASGNYLFDGLTAGNYTVYVDTTTLPSGMTQSGDPDGILNNQSMVALGTGETNMDQDFGYSGPPPFTPSTPVIPSVAPPVQPLVIPAPPVVPGNPVILPASGGIVPDAFFMYQEFGDRIEEDVFFYPFDETPWLEPILPVSPIYTGHAEPGTTLNFILHDAMGNEIGHQSVMADTAGNWLASFPGSLMYDLPHHMVVEQTGSTYNVSSDGFFNMRTYFNPNFASMAISSTRYDVAEIFAYLPSTVMLSVHESNLSTIHLEWNDFNGYEFFAPSTNPARDGH